MPPRSSTAAPRPKLATRPWGGSAGRPRSTRSAGRTLVGLLKTLRYHGLAVACGLAGGAALEATVFPFILRGVRLVGIDSVYAPEGIRRRAWEQLAAEIEPARLDAMSRVISLDEVPATAADLLRGSVRGRVVVDLGAG